MVTAVLSFRALFRNASWMFCAGFSIVHSLAGGTERQVCGDPLAVSQNSPPGRIVLNCQRRGNLPEGLCEIWDNLARLQVLKVVDRAPQPFFQSDAGLPAEQPAGFGNLRLALFGVVFRQGTKLDRRTRAGQSLNAPGELQNGDLRRISQIYGGSFVRFDQSAQAFHKIRDVAEAAGLAAVAEDGKRLALQRLIDQRRDHAAVAKLHAGAISIEDTCDMSRQTEFPVVSHG